MKVLMVGMGWFPEERSGLTRYFRYLLVALRRSGLDTRALVTGPATDAPDGVTSVAPTGASFARRVARVGGAVRRGSTTVEVTDVHFAPYATMPALLGAWRRRPLVVHFHGPWAIEAVSAGDRSRARRSLRALMERTVYRRADALVTLSGAHRDLLVSDHRLPPWAVEVIPPGVDLDRFAPLSGPQRDVLRERLGFGRDEWVVLCPRRLVPRTGVDVLIEAWPTILREVPEAALVIAGDGPERQRLEHLTRRLGVEDSVRFAGPVADDVLADLYRAADVTVVPSRELEGFGLVALEALASGCPVVASDTGGLRESLGPLADTSLVPAGEAPALAERLVDGAVGHRPLPSPAICRERASPFSWSDAARRHRALYEGLVHGGPGRPLRAVFFDHCAQPSGAELAGLRIASALEQVDVHFVLAQPGPLVDRIRDAGLSVEILPLDEGTRNLSRHRLAVGRLPASALVHSAGYVLSLARRLRRLRPDLLHTMTLKAALLGTVAARLARVPVVVNLQDRLAEDYLTPMGARGSRAVIRALATAVVANSHATAASLGERWCTAVVPNPGDPQAFSSSGDRGGGGPLRVGMIGRIDPWKGHEVFLRAFARAFPDGEAEAVVVGAPLFGEEQHEQALHDLARDLGIDGRTTFTGFRADLGAVLDELDVLVHASVIPEPFGQVVVEGMAAGLAVVASDAGGPSEVIEHGETGLLSGPGEVGELAGHLRRLHDDADLRCRLGQAARGAADRYRPERVAAGFRDVYEELLAREASGKER